MIKTPIDIGGTKVSNLLNAQECADIDKVYGNTLSHETENNNIIGDTLSCQQKSIFDVRNSDDDKFINSVMVVGAGRSVQINVWPLTCGVNNPSLYTDTFLCRGGSSF